MVLKNDGTARCLWKIAKVTKLIESKDGKIKARTRNNNLKETVALTNTD